MSAGDPDTVNLNKDETMDDKQEDGQNALPTAQQLTSEMMQNPQVLAALQSRLDHIVGSTSGYIESLPKSIKRRIHALKNLQVASSKVEAKFYEEVHELERKYASLYQPLFDKRCNIVSGGYEPTEEECEWESDEEDEDEEFGGDKVKKVDETGKDEVKCAAIEMENLKTDDSSQGIPSFWLTIFKNVPLLEEMIQDHDEPILEKLKDIKVSFSSPDETMGFTLEFLFDANKFFSNTVLTKQYTLQSQPDEKAPFTFEGPEIVGCTGCKIDWNKGQNVTVKTIKKKQKHKGKGTIRTVTKQIPNDSFFNFFNPPEVPEDEEEEMDPDTEALLASDFEIGHLVRDRIIPRAVLYFTGEIDDDFDEEGEEEEDEEENGFNDEDDSNSENDPDFDPEKDPKSKETPQECNQQ